MSQSSDRVNVVPHPLQTNSFSSSRAITPGERSEPGARGCGETFPRKIADCLEPESDSTRFVRKVEGLVSTSHARPAGGRATRRAHRRHVSGPGLPFWKIGLAAAAAVAAALLLRATLAPAPTVPGPAAKASPEKPEPTSDLLLPPEHREDITRQLEAAESEKRRINEEIRRASDDASRRQLEIRQAELARTADEFRARLEAARRQEPIPPEENPSEKPQAEPRQTTGTEAMAASLVAAEGDVWKIHGDRRDQAVPGSPIPPGWGIETLHGTAVASFPDGTRIEIGPNTETREHRTEGGKRIFIARGTVSAEIPRQPASQPMVFATPNAEARVLGTGLRIAVDPAPGRQSTRLEVTEGRVQLKSLSTGRTVDVPAGYCAVAAHRPRRQAALPVLRGFQPE